ncbi:hypothetical protein [Nitrososphaeria virus YSH_1032793]|uniref:Uncharacterized protein n=1 Tax=Nitrososphaeria virus YSH_1032793 TaxID=3071320 RepID=A0A976UAB1_9CAUD|nr:hypothetical protein QKV91_gp03 [Yangshan Harbor Nitrososphaeria virus]UVF62207.1 hypothetical protein [Nitrososphaeria virus YSH_1032793]
MKKQQAFTQMGNIIFKGSLASELASEMMSKAIVTDTRTDFVQVVYSTGEKELLPVPESKEQTEAFDARTKLIKDIETRRIEISTQSRKLAKQLLKTVTSYSNELHNGHVLFQTKNVEDLQKRNLIQKNMKFNYQRVHILPDNTLLQSPTLLINTGL